MKLTKLLIPALLIPLMAAAEGRRIDAGESVLEPIQKRDSILIADQLHYSLELKDITEGTPIALPEVSTDPNSPMQFIGGWQLDSVRVSKKKEVPARYNIKASLTLTTFMGGTYELPPLPVLVDGDTLIFHPTEPLVVTELPVDMENFVPGDIKPQVKVPYTAGEILLFFVLPVLGLAAVVALVLWLVKRSKRKKEEQEHAEPAHIRALRKLDQYRGDKLWAPEKQKTFYSGVTDTLREYIAARYGVGALEMTTGEIFEGLKGTDVPKDLFDEMQDLFVRADFVKFAKYTATEQENAQVLPQAVKFVTTTYQSELEEESKKEETE